MKISLAFGEPALWSVTDGDSWHTRGRAYTEPPGGSPAGGLAGWSTARVLESNRSGFKCWLHGGNASGLFPRALVSWSVNRGQ